MHLPSGGGDWGCWPPGKRSLRLSVEGERETERGEERKLSVRTL